MRNKQTMLFLILSLFAVIAWGQTNTNSVPVPNLPGVKAEATNFVLAIIPLAVPVIIAAFRKGLTFIPAWTYPVVAALLGVGLNALSGLKGWGETSPIYAAILGLAGTGVREAIVQVKDKIVPEKTIT